MTNTFKDCRRRWTSEQAAAEIARLTAALAAAEERANLHKEFWNSETRKAEKAEAALADAEERCRHETTEEAGCDWLRCSDCGKFIVRSVAERAALVTRAEKAEAALADTTEALVAMQRRLDTQREKSAKRRSAIAAAEERLRSQIEANDRLVVALFNAKSALAAAEEREKRMGEEYGKATFELVDRYEAAEAALAAAEGTIAKYNITLSEETKT